MTENEAALLAADAGLRYTSDTEPGYRRERRGRGFSYRRPDGSLAGDEKREWFESLAIPPAWSDVWICSDKRGHILATGYDDAGRKQYIYHPDWEEVRDAVKFDRMWDFGRKVGRLRRTIDADLRTRGLPRQKVVALAVAVLDRTLMRVGSRRYLEQHGSHGLTTITSRHVDINGGDVLLAFEGKGGKDQTLAIEDQRLAALIGRCQELAGQTLFSYQAGDVVEAISSTDVNQYLADAIGRGFSAKDVRTWGANTAVVGHLAGEDHGGERTVSAAIEFAAEKLGNTPTVCRTSYVHPTVTESFDDGRFEEAWRRSRRGQWIDRTESALNVLGTLD